MINRIKILSLLFCLCFCSFAYSNNIAAIPSNDSQLVAVDTNDKGTTNSLKSRLDARRLMKQQQLQQQQNATGVTNPASTAPGTPSQASPAKSLYEQNLQRMRGK